MGNVHLASGFRTHLLLTHLVLTHLVLTHAYEVVHKDLSVPTKVLFSKTSKPTSNLTYIQLSDL